jgi:hypothetical protein
MTSRPPRTGLEAGSGDLDDSGGHQLTGDVQHAERLTATAGEPGLKHPETGGQDARYGRSPRIMPTAPTDSNQVR